MPATAGSVTVACPACDDEITVELRFHTPPRADSSEPLRIELEPDLDSVRTHIATAHAETPTS